MSARSASNSLATSVKGRLVLASSSVYRRALLKRFGLPFTWQAPEIDESSQVNETPLALVRRLALAKARALVADQSNALIIGSDQVAIIDGQPLGKPGNEADAVLQIEAASGRTVRFLTSVCVFDATRRAYELAVVTSDVRFRRLDVQHIRNYVRRERPLDCAGSFKCEGLGIALFDAIIADDPTALIGLPLIALAAMLARAGLNILDDSP